MRRTYNSQSRLHLPLPTHWGAGLCPWTSSLLSTHSPPAALDSPNHPIPLLPRPPSHLQYQAPGLPTCSSWPPLDHASWPISLRGPGAWCHPTLLLHQPLVWRQILSALPFKHFKSATSLLCLALSWLEPPQVHFLPSAPFSAHSPSVDIPAARPPSALPAPARHTSLCS